MTEKKNPWEGGNANPRKEELQNILDLDKELRDLRRPHQALLRDVLSCFEDMKVMIMRKMEKEDFDSLIARLRAAVGEE